MAGFWNLPFTFASLSGNQPASDLDACYQAVATQPLFLSSPSGGPTNINGVPPLGFAAYVAGMQFSWVQPATNTGAVTLTVLAPGPGSAAALTRSGAVALVAGDLVINRIYTAEYDGTRFQLINYANGYEQDTQFLIIGSASPIQAGFGGSSVQNSMAGAGNSSIQFDAGGLVTGNWRCTPATGGSVQWWTLGVQYYLTHNTAFPAGTILQTSITRFNAANVAQSRLTIEQIGDAATFNTTSGSGNIVQSITTAGDYFSVETLMNTAGNYNVFGMNFYGWRIR